MLDQWITDLQVLERLALFAEEMAAPEAQGNDAFGLAMSADYRNEARVLRRAADFIRDQTAAKAVIMRGASNGGKARAKALTKAERVKIAQKGAKARWGK